MEATTSRWHGRRRRASSVADAADVADVAVYAAAAAVAAVAAVAAAAEGGGGARLTSLVLLGIQVCLFRFLFCFLF